MQQVTAPRRAGTRLDARLHPCPLMTPTLMPALRVHDFAGPKHWRLEDVPVPTPGPGQVLVRVAATAISFVDLLQARGGYQVKPALPTTPGTEFSGHVVSTGDGVSGWTPGQTVAGKSSSGAWAQYTLAEADALLPLPADVDPVAASDLAVTAATAVHALHQRAQLQAHETVLILGAAGGVGLAAVQVARDIGAAVVAAARSPAKREALRALGADHVIDSQDPQWRDALRAWQPQGVDVVIDPLGGAYTEPAFRSLRWGGRHIVVGFAAGDIPRLPTNLPLLKGAALMGVDIRQLPLQAPDTAAANQGLTAALFERGVLNTPVASRLDHRDWAEAVSKAQERAALGKVVMTW